MKNLLTLVLSTLLLTFISCKKEEIIPTTPDPSSGIIDTSQGVATNSGNGGTSGNETNNSSTNTTQTTTLEYISDDADLSTFHEALIKTGMDASVTGDGPFTVFAPNNEAFQNFLAHNNWNSIDDVAVGTLTTIVKFHLSLSDVTLGDLTNDTAVTTMFNNFELYVHTGSSPIKVTLGLTEAKVIEGDIEQTNGNVNIIDGVLSL